MEKLKLILLFIFLFLIPLINVLIIVLVFSRKRNIVIGIILLLVGIIPLFLSFHEIRYSLGYLKLESLPIGTVVKREYHSSSEGASTCLSVRVPVCGNVILRTQVCSDDYNGFYEGDKVRVWVDRKCSKVEAVYPLYVENKLSSIITHIFQGIFLGILGLIFILIGIGALFNPL